MQTQKIFLASSSELKEDRKEFEIFVNRKNKDWVSKGVFLELVLWEDFLDAMSPTRLQDEYNKKIRQCDVFVMLFFTKVGPYTAEEFETAFGQFQATRKPFIFTYFKDAEISTGSANQKDLMSLWAFQEKLDALGHFYTRYQNIDALKLHFGQQLDKLVAGGFIEFKPDKETAAGSATYPATVAGGGAIAQGGGTAVGEKGVSVGGRNTGSINTGTQTRIDTGGGAYVGGGVHTGGGTFVGRDQFTVPGPPDASLAELRALVAELGRLLEQVKLPAEIGEIVAGDFKQVERQVEQDAPKGALVKSRLSSLKELLSGAETATGLGERIVAVLGKAARLAGLLFP